jgi:Domain of unknown function (DUF6438)
MTNECSPVKNIYILLIIYFFISCKNEDSINYKELILGHWKEMGDTVVKMEWRDGKLTPKLPPPPGNNLLEEFSFQKDSVVEKMAGFFEFSPDSFFGSKRIYLGRKSKYIVKDSLLSLYDLATKQWSNHIIRKITNDSMMLITLDGDSNLYLKKNYQIDSTISADQIIISETNCLGGCPEDNLSININGELYYYGQNRSSKRGIFKGYLPKIQFINIVNEFKKADFIHLKNEYSTGATDCSSVFITFIKDGEIIKSISDYCVQSPEELIWAYQNTKYSFMNAQLSTFKDTPQYLLFEIGGFTTKKKICYLSKSEGFYLWTFFHGKHINSKSFIPKYRLAYYDTEQTELIDHIVTDGRYYKFGLKNGQSDTYDIGIDFIEMNNLELKFERKKGEEPYYKE